MQVREHWGLLCHLALLRGVRVLLPCVGLLTHLFLPSDPGPVNLTVISCTVCQLSPKTAGRTTAPRDASPHPCVSAFICSLGLFLTAGWPPPADSFLSGFWTFFSSLHTLTYLLPSVIASTPSPRNRERLISPSCRAEFLSTVCPCSSACLSGFPHAGPRTPCWCCSLPCRCTCLGVATDTSSFSVFISLPSYCWVVTDFPVILETFFPSEISQVCARLLLVHAFLPPLLDLRVFHLYSLWWATHMPWNVHPCIHSVSAICGHVPESAAVYMEGELRHFSSCAHPQASPCAHP